MKSYPKQLHIFFNALSFFTRLPIPTWVEFSPENQKHATQFFTWVGLIVGVIAAVSFWLFQQIFPQNVAIILSMLTGIWLTGGLHEDGLADAFDGFGGGWNAEQVLKIMKDSRIGSYGVLAIVGITLLKFTALNQVSSVMLAIVVGHVLSRIPALVIMSSLPYLSHASSSPSLNISQSQSENQSKSSALAHKLPLKAYIIAAVPVGIVFLVSPFMVILALLVVFAMSVLLVYYFRSRIQGYNGDCLGASQQLAEVLIYLLLCSSFIN